MRALEDLFRYILTRRSASAALADPAAALQTAMEADVVGALYAAVRRHGHSDLLQADMLRSLRDAHASNAAHALELITAYREIAEAFAAEGIPMRPLKGLALIEAGAIENLGSRYCLDIDLLTRPSDRAAVTRILESRRFATSGVRSTHKHLSPFQRGNVLVEVHEIAFWGRGERAWDLDDLLATDPLVFALVHLVHHAYVSSVVTGPVVAKTLLDVAAIREVSTAQPSFAASARSLARAAGLERELDDLWRVAEIFQDDLEPDGAVARVLAAIAPTKPADDFRRLMSFYRRAAFEGPRALRSEFVRTLIIPDRATMATIYGLPPGSPLVYPTYALRPLHLAFRLAQRIASIRSNQRER